MRRYGMYALIALWMCVPVVYAQDDRMPAPISEEYATAVVLSQTADTVGGDVTTGELGLGGGEQRVQIRFRDGAYVGEIVEAVFYHPIAADGADSRPHEQLSVGETVVVLVAHHGDQTTYDIVAPYRVTRMIGVFVVFLLITTIVGRWHGVSSVVGLLASLLILAGWVLPRIAAGASPVMTSLWGALAIACVSLYVAHGFNRRTTLALCSTLVTLLLSVGIAYFVVSMTRLMGFGTDEAYYFSATFGAGFDMRGLLLGAIIIGAVGVLDDITTAQTATIEEIHKANRMLSMRELFRSGISVGKEHIASLVNTLAIAYIGASLPLFLLMTSAQQPLWVILNSEHIAEEIARTLAGSMTLVCAVPIATYCAAYYYGSRARSSGANITDNTQS